MPQIVQDIMSPQPVTVTMDSTMAQVRSIFEQHRFHHLIVIGDDGRAAGVLSDRDLLKTVSPFIGRMSERTVDTDSLNRRAHQVMSRSLVMVRSNTLLRSAARVMLDRRISCLPVVDADRRCVGILTLRDVVRWSLERMEQQANEENRAGTTADRRAA